MAYAQGSYPMIRFLDQLGVKFEKDGSGEYNVRKVHHMGTYVLPMPEGHHVKKILYRQLRRLQVAVTNRFMATRLLKAADGRIAGAIGVNTRTGEFLVVRAKAVILACGAAGRLGLPASGYLFGTYENAANSGDGYAMAFHAGAELANLECFQINPLIKDYNGPACAYVTGPFGGYTANNRGQRFIECDYWSGQMMLEFWRELQSGIGTGVPEARPSRIGDHRRDRDHPALERAAVARPVPRAPRHELSAPHDRDAHLRDRLLLRSQRIRRLGERACARRPCPASTPPATWPAFRTTTCSAPSSTAASPGQTAADYCAETDLPRARRGRHRGRAGARSRADAARGRPHPLRDGVQDPASGQRLSAAAEDHRARSTSGRSGSPRCARTSDQLVAARSARADARARDPIDPRLRRSGGGGLALSHREPLGPLPPARGLSRDRQRQLVLPQHALQGRQGPHRPSQAAEVAPYIVPVAADEMSAYHHLRIKTPVAAE